MISDRTPWRDLQEQGAGWDLPLEDAAEFARALATLAAMDEPAHQAMRAKAIAMGRSIANCPDVIAAYRRLFRDAASWNAAVSAPAPRAA